MALKFNKGTAATQVTGGTNLAAILAAIHKEKGPQTVVRGDNMPTVTRLPSGLFEFDFFTGGGFPEGRYSIVYGPESSGKTNLAWRAIRQAQRRPPPCNKAVYVNVEQSYDPIWAMKMGVDVGLLEVVNSLYGEETIDLVDALVRAEDLACIVVDSLAAIIPSKEIAQSVETADVGTSSLLIKRLCNKLMYAFGEESRRGHFPCVILINQTRYKIGVLFGDPETMPGGEAQKFLSSLRVRLYGKNEIIKTVNPNLPCFKDTNVVIKKAKVPVLSQAFSYKQCLYAHDGLEIGETRSWNMLSGYLKSLGQLTKTTKGWNLQGENFQTLADAQNVYEAQPKIMAEWQHLVIDAFKAQSILIDEVSH